MREYEKPIRVNRQNPCPICERPDWCTISADGSIAFCMRIASDKQAMNGSYIHRLNEPLIVPKPVHRPKPAVPQADMLEMATLYFNHCRDCRPLASQLGISTESLRRLGCGHDGKNWSFPMFDDRRQVIGIKLRPPKGRKFCVRGSHLGINWPARLVGKGPLVVAEGETDTGAALDMGFDAIGRPSCTGGVEIILEFLTQHPGYRDIWVMADADEKKQRRDGSWYYPGQDGAERLIQRIHDGGRPRRIKLIHPPIGKDLRAWHHSGATREAVELVAANTDFYREDE